MHCSTFWALIIFWLTTALFPLVHLFCYNPALMMWQEHWECELCHAASALGSVLSSAEPSSACLGKVCERKGSTALPLHTFPFQQSVSSWPWLHHKVPVLHDLTNTFKITWQSKAMNVTLQFIGVNLLPPRFASEWVLISFLGFLPCTAAMAISKESFLEPLLGPLI